MTLPYAQQQDGLYKEQADPVDLPLTMPAPFIKTLGKLVGVGAGASIFLGIFYYILLHTLSIFHDLSLLLGGIRW